MDGRAGRESVRANPYPLNLHKILFKDKEVPDYERLYHCVSSLTPLQERCIILHFKHCLTYSQIVNTLNINYTDVEKIFAASYKKMRKWWGIL